MEFPSGQSSHSHTHHTHHNRQRDEDDPNYDLSETYPPPGRSSPFSSFDQPPSNFYGENYPPPPQPPTAHVTHVSHSSHTSPYPFYQPPISEDLSYSAYPPPSRPDYSSNYESEPTRVHHVAHDVVDQQPYGGESVMTHQDHHFRPHLPSSVHHHTHQSNTAFDLSDLHNRPTFKIYCKANQNFSLSIRDGRVILSSADTSDPFQVSVIQSCLLTLLNFTCFSYDFAAHLCFCVHYFINNRFFYNFLVVYVRKYELKIVFISSFSVSVFIFLTSVSVFFEFFRF